MNCVHEDECQIIVLWYELVMNYAHEDQTLKEVKGPYANHILIPQGSTASSTFFDIKWKPIFF